MLPPRKLYHPVLVQQIKVDNYKTLLFPLCKTCAETNNQNNCEHTIEERALIGTWPTIEVNKGLKRVTMY